MRTLYLECNSGISGDMTVALDVRAPARGPADGFRMEIFVAREPRAARCRCGVDCDWRVRHAARKHYISTVFQALPEALHYRAVEPDVRPFRVAQVFL